MGDKKKAAPKTYQVRISLNALPNIDEITGYIALHPERKPAYILKLKLYYILLPGFARKPALRQALCCAFVLLLLL
jgi:hypothetical protein